MQELKLKNNEIVKINNSRFCLRILPDSNRVEMIEVTEEKEIEMIKTLLDDVYSREFTGFWYTKTEIDCNKDRYINVYNCEDNATKKYYFKFLRIINHPSYYGLSEEENTAYYIYCDYENNDVELFRVIDGRLSIVYDFREKLLNGDLIK